MIPGFNLDIKHKGKTFHIQTEDSGPQNPVIMTHLFIFGTILGSRRLDYGADLERADLTNHVRDLMRAELREMHRALLRGDFDELARRPQKKAGGAEIPLARRTNAPEAGGPALGATDSPAPVEPIFTEESTALTQTRLPGGGHADPFTTLDAEDIEELSEAAIHLDSVSGSVDEPGARGEPLEPGDIEDGSLADDELVSIIEEPAAGPAPIAPVLRPPAAAAAVADAATLREAFPSVGGSLVQDRSTLPARLTNSATPVRAPRANVEFPTDLVAEMRFDDVILAWLLEDVDEP